MVLTTLEGAVEALGSRLAEHKRAADAWVAKAIPELERLGLGPMELAPIPAPAYHARAWAARILEREQVGAVDGSQVFPPLGLALPVAVVQVAWRWNGGGASEEGRQIHPLGPEDLEGEAAARVNERRFLEECRVLTGIVRSRPGVYFMDGGFAISFVRSLDRRSRDRHVAAMREVVEASAERRVPVVGYVAHSRARDVVSRLETAVGVPAPGITDAYLYARVLTGRGSVSRPFTLDRDEVSAVVGSPGGGIRVAYVDVGGVVSRLEWPAWMDESGPPLDVVRAQLVAGGGYPYILDSVHRLAVIHESQARRLIDRLCAHALGVDPKLVAKSRAFRGGPVR